MSIENIKKRSGELVAYDIEKVIKAIYKGMLSVEHDSMSDAKKIAKKVDKKLIKFTKAHK